MNIVGAKHLMQDWESEGRDTKHPAYTVAKAVADEWPLSTSFIMRTVRECMELEKSPWSWDDMVAALKQYKVIPNWFA